MRSSWRRSPAYAEPQPEYLFAKRRTSGSYLDFCHAQIRELLTNYGPVAGFWFDPIMGYYSRPDLFPMEETYAMIRSIQPGVLIGFKQGANGEEDYVAPERKPRAHPKAARSPRRWERNEGKEIEICGDAPATGVGL